MMTHTHNGLLLTPEQAAVINTKIVPGTIKKVVAGAGTGKSTVLENLAHNNPNVQFLYLAFNRSVRLKAKTSFPSNVRCDTFNSLAWRLIGVDYMKGGILNGISFRSICTQFGVPLRVSASIRMTLENFLNSGSLDISCEHLFVHPKINSGPDIEDSIIKSAKALWAIMVKGENKWLRMTHSGCLKLLHLRAPELGAACILCDESQDTNPVSMSILEKERSRGSALVVVGDPRQQIYCQPKGTMIAVPSFINSRRGSTSFLSKPIESIVVGDSVVTYGMAKGYGSRTGNRIADIQKFEFSGKLVVVRAGGCISEYTPEHHCIVRLGELLDNKFVVYLMKKGNLFRVGRTSGIYASQHGQVGISIRCSQEKAESMWVLSVHNTVHEAAFAEGTAAWKFGIPTMNFVAQKNHLLGQDGLNKFWSGIGDNSKKAKKLLLTYGRDIRFPLWVRGKSNLLIRRPFVTAACNLMSGMKVMLLSEFDKKGGKRISTESWTPVEVSRRRYRGMVYSLSVEKHHTYFGDGILTHNSWRGAVDAMQGIDCESFNLTQSFRFNKRVSFMANKLLKAYSISMFDLVGASNRTDHLYPVSIPKNVRSGTHAYLARTNVGAFGGIIDLIDQGETVAFNGDVGVFIGTIMDIYALKSNKPDDVSKYGRLKHYRTYEEFLDVCGVDPELNSLKNIVEKFGDKIPDMVQRINDCLARDVRFATVVVSTVHKAKGLEYECLTMADDFPALVKDKKLLPIRTNLFEKRGDVIDQEDLHIMYVAITRAKCVLAIPQTLVDFLDVLRASPDGPVFYEPPVTETSSRSKDYMEDFFHGDPGGPDNEY